MSQVGSLGGGIIPPGGVVETLTGDTGGPVGPDGANNINIISGDNINIAGIPGISTLEVSVSGTTDHALQLGNAAGSLTSLGVATNGQLPIGSTGSDPVLAVLTPGTNTSITNGAGSITIGASQAVVANNYSVANASPYVVTATDYYITVDTSTIPITIQLPDAPTNYRIFIIKDSAGNASANNITVTTVSGIKVIDAAATYVMNSDYQSIHVLYDAFGYQVF